MKKTYYEKNTHNYTNIQHRCTLIYDTF